MPKGKKIITKKVKEFTYGNYEKVKKLLRFTNKNITLAYEEIIKEYSTKKIKNIDKKINSLKSKADNYHTEIIDIKKDFLKADKKNFKVIDKKQLLENLLQNKNTAIPKKDAINKEAFDRTISSKIRNYTLKELEKGGKGPVVRDLEEHFNVDKKRNMLSKEIRKKIEFARNINKEIAKLEIIRLNILLKEQVERLEGASKIDTKEYRERLIKSIFSKYEKNVIGITSLRELIKYINIELEIAKLDGIINSAKKVNKYLEDKAKKIEKLDKIKKIRDIFPFLKSK